MVYLSKEKAASKETAIDLGRRVSVTNKRAADNYSRRFVIRSSESEGKCQGI